MAIASETRRLTVTSRFAYTLDVPTPMLLMVAPQDGARQTIESQTVKTEPYADLIEYVDALGNRVHRVVTPAGPFAVSVETVARVAAVEDDGTGAPFVPVTELPPAVIPFILPSRYVESDTLGPQAESIVGTAPAGFGQVAAIVGHIRKAFRYTPGSSPDPTSAREILGRSDAVCRDMAHLGIALCRALSIPARMVVGYLEGLEPQDVHAWFEAYCGGRWWTCDPTQPTVAGGRVVIAYGRDAADVAINTSFGTGVEAAPPAITVTAESA